MTFEEKLQKFQQHYDFSPSEMLLIRTACRFAQEDMRERAASECDDLASRTENVTIFIGAEKLGEKIRNLPIEV